MNLLLEKFIIQIEKNFDKTFILKDYSIKCLEEFFNSYEEQLDFFSFILKDMNLDSLQITKNCEFNVIVSFFIVSKYHENNLEIKLDSFKNKLENKVCLPIHNQIFGYLMKLIKILKSKINDKSKKIFSSFELLKNLSSIIEIESNPENCLTFLNLFEYCLNSFSLKKNFKNQKKFEMIICFFDKIVIRILLMKDLSIFIEQNKSENRSLLFLEMIQKIIFSFYLILNENQQIYHDIANIQTYEIIKFLDDILSENFKKHDEIIVFLINSILNLGIIKEENLKIFLPDSNLLKKTLNLLEEKQNHKKEGIYSGKLLMNVIKIVEGVLNKSFNSNYFEEIYLMLDEYVLHLIEPTFIKIFAILGDNKKDCFWFEKKCINFLMRKSLSHK